jgi:uncharacterized protein involved in exopolysaccharide biosynthesis
MQTTPPPQDDISLRELYLILKRGLLGIVAFAVVAGLATHLITSFIPPSYEAEATVLVMPPPVRVEGPRNLRFVPSSEVSFEAYQTLAESRGVLEAAVQRVDSDLSPRDLAAAGRLSRLLGPQRADQAAPLSVVHTVRHQDPLQAAALADAWAQSALETVREALLANLGPVDATTAEEVERLRRELETVEVRWHDFKAQDRGAILQARLNDLTSSLAQGEEYLNELERRLATARAQRELLTARLADTPPANEGALELLTPLARGGGAEGATAPLMVMGSSPGTLVAALDQSELQRVELAISGLAAERDLLAMQLEAYQQQADTLLSEIAALELERAALERELTRARAAYEDVVALQPLITFVGALSPTGARMLSGAAVPTDPVAPRRTLSTLIAVVLAAMVATVFVFLREAVRDPSSNVEAERRSPPKQVQRHS